MKQTYHTPNLVVVRTQCRDIITESPNSLSVDFNTTITRTDEIGAPERRMEDF
ncbi:MAG: hypothetical protein J6T19_03070 [Paludibacteraceae bacterium]|nr:hypothetical protein [Paludibacteraceae bacterium]